LLRCIQFLSFFNSLCRHRCPDIWNSGFPNITWNRGSAMLYGIGHF
jgi:hypothetical protein